jgi:hypothetical protein
MSTTRKHNLDEVLRSLSKKHDCRIQGREIKILTDKVFNKKTQKEEDNPFKRFDLGNGSWGKIDFLVNYCGYHVVRVKNL